MAGLMKAAKWFREPPSRKGSCVSLILLVRPRVKHHAKARSERLGVIER